MYKNINPALDFKKRSGKKRDNKINTGEKIFYKGKSRNIFVGLRGGKYVFINNKYISLPREIGPCPKTGPSLPKTGPSPPKIDDKKIKQLEGELLQYQRVVDLLDTEISKLKQLYSKVIKGKGISSLKLESCKNKIKKYVENLRKSQVQINKLKGTITSLEDKYNTDIGEKSEKHKKCTLKIKELVKKQKQTDEILKRANSAIRMFNQNALLNSEKIRKQKKEINEVMGGWALTLAENKKSNKKVENLQSIIEFTAKKNTKYFEEIKELNDQLNDQLIELKSLRENKPATTIQVGFLRGKIKKLQTKLKEAEKFGPINEDLQKQVQNLGNEISQLRKENIFLGAIKKSQYKRLEENFQKITQLNKDYLDALKLLREYKTTIINKNTQLERFANLEENLNECNKNATKFTAKITLLEKTLDSLNTEKDNFEQELLACNDALNTLKKNEELISSLEESINSLQQESSQLNENIKSVKSDAQTERERFRKELKDNKKEAAALQSQYKELQDDLTRQLTSFKKDKKNQGDSDAYLRAQISKNKKEYESLSQSKEACIKELQESKYSYDELNKMILVEKGKYKSLSQQQLEDFKTQFGKIQQTLADTQKELSSKINDYKDCQTQLKKISNKLSSIGSLVFKGGQEMEKLAKDKAAYEVILQQKEQLNQGLNQQIDEYKLANTVMLDQKKLDSDELQICKDKIKMYEEVIETQQNKISEFEQQTESQQQEIQKYEQAFPKLELLTQEEQTLPQITRPGLDVVTRGGAITTAEARQGATWGLQS